jgi:hypothetical protein
MGNHLTTILLLPLLFSALPESRWHSLLRRILWMGAGLLVYLILPLRALRSPPVNWGNPVTWHGFRWLITGRLYQASLLDPTPTLAWERVRMVSGFLLDQSGLVGVTLAVIGLVFFFRTSALTRNSIWIMAAFLIFAVVYSTYDSFVYLLPACLGLSIWIGVGLSGVMSMLSRRLALALSLSFVLFLFVLAGTHRGEVDASQDKRAEMFGDQVLASVPEKAIVFAKGDRAVFALWYFHFALQERPDLFIIATDLLHHDWYQQNLHAIYPNLHLPGPFPFPETIAASNPDHLICLVEYVEESLIECQSESTGE